MNRQRSSQEPLNLPTFLVPCAFAGLPHSKVSLWCPRKPRHHEKKPPFVFFLDLGNITIFPGDIINKIPIETKGQLSYFVSSLKYGTAYLQEAGII